MALRMVRSATQHASKPMRAGVYYEFGGPIAVEDVPRPIAPPGGVVLEVRATGVCRSDWHGWKGHDGDVIAHGLPFTPGHEVSGVVVERGAGVELPAGQCCQQRRIHSDFLYRILFDNAFRSAFGAFQAR